MSGGEEEIVAKNAVEFRRVSRQVGTLSRLIVQVQDGENRADLANKGTMALLALVEMQRLLKHKIVVMAEARERPTAHRLAIEKATEALRVQNRKLENLSKELEKLIQEATGN
jgi:hypothetical protein